MMDVRVLSASFSQGGVFRADGDRLELKGMKQHVNKKDREGNPTLVSRGVMGLDRERTPYRILDTPAPDKWADLGDLVKAAP